MWHAVDNSFRGRPFGRWQHTQQGPKAQAGLSTGVSGVFHQAVGDGRGHGDIEKDVVPLGERSVGSDDCALVLAMAGGDHLIKEVRGLLIERDISSS